MFENKVYPGIREMLARLKDADLTLGGGNLEAGTVCYSDSGAF